MLQLPLLAAVVALSLSFAHASPPFVVRDSIVTLPMARRMNLNGTGSGHRLVQHDQARARRLISRILSPQRRDDGIVPVDVVNQVVSYLVDVGDSSFLVGPCSPLIRRC